MWQVGRRRRGGRPQTGRHLPDRLLPPVLSSIKRPWCTYTARVQATAVTRLPCDSPCLSPLCALTSEISFWQRRCHTRGQPADLHLPALPPLPPSSSPPQATVPNSLPSTACTSTLGKATAPSRASLWQSVLHALALAACVVAPHRSSLPPPPPPPPPRLLPCHYQHAYPLISHPSAPGLLLPRSPPLQHLLLLPPRLPRRPAGGAQRAAGRGRRGVRRRGTWRRSSPSQHYTVLA